MGRISDLKENAWVKLALILIGLAFLILLFRALHTIILYFLIAFIAAYICDPIIDWMEKKGLSRTIGISILTVVICLVVALFWLVAIPMFASEMARMTSDLPRYFGQLKSSILPWIENTFNIAIPANYDDWMGQLSAHEDTIKAYVAKLSEPVWDIVSHAFASITGMIMSLLGIIVIPVAWFYLLRDIDPLKERLFEFVPLRFRESTGGFLKEVNDAVSNFLQGQVIVCGILAVLYIIGLEFIVGVPLGFLIGLFSGFASLVPYLGLIMGIVPALVLAFLEYGDWLHPLGVVLTFVIAQALEGTVITPKIVGDKLGLHPVTVIFGILIWGELLGFVGILIAVPATAIFQVALRHLVKKYFSSDLFREKHHSPLESGKG